MIDGPYYPDGRLHVCRACTINSVRECSYSPENPSGHEMPDFCHTDHKVRVVDTDAHDRWHNERAAQADPAQAAML